MQSLDHLKKGRVEAVRRGEEKGNKGGESEPVQVILTWPSSL